MTRLLASVNSLREAILARQAGADIIDLKAPDAGALGALPLTAVAEICAWRPDDTTLSATVGDLPMYPEIIRPAVQAMAATGVDYVKIGFFPGGDWPGVAMRLAPLAANGIKLIAVLFADNAPDVTFIPTLKRTCFTGVMLDTMKKDRGSLRQVMAEERIESFVVAAKQQDMLCGLAGSLRLQDIPPLLRYQADYLGFRGALCVASQRTNELDYDAILRIKHTIQGDITLFAGV